MRILLRGQPWDVREQAVLGDRSLFRLQCPDSGEIVEALCPPDEFEPLADPAPTLDRRSLTPLAVWRLHHEALRFQCLPDSRYAAFHAGRISPEPYQFAPLARLLAGPRRSVLIADDVGLGKTVEAGICLLELIARGVGRRILLVVPPGLIPQWQDEMREKFGLAFQPVENAASLDRAQTLLSEGLQPWAYFDRVITSVEYLKRRDVHTAALAHPWDVIVVDEAHYLAESGTPANPYATARTRLGPKLREASRSLILLTATPHNGYEFITPEFRPRASLLVTNWGRQARWGGQGERFELCPACGRHRPPRLTDKQMQSWDDDHQKVCDGRPRQFVLGYSFSADVLVLAVPGALVPEGEPEAKSFCRTLGKALVVGAQEMLEIEADEIAYFHHPDGADGWTLTFYETAPGGAGYLEQLAANLGKWAQAAHQRLFGHDCERACYRCLKSSRNQFDHALLNKELVRDTLFQFGHAEMTGEPHEGKVGEGRDLSSDWLANLKSARASPPTSDTPIERALLEAIRSGARLPEPVAQYAYVDERGVRATVPDFAYPDKKIAIYCDGFAYHGNRDSLEGDAIKRNLLQSNGWAVLTFWGRQILRDPQACERQIWQCYEFRRDPTGK